MKTTGRMLAPAWLPTAAAVSAISLALLLAGCGSKNDASERNFSAALTHYLDDNGDLCLDVGPFPVDVSEVDLKQQANEPAGHAAQMAALQHVGLVGSIDVSLGQLGFVDDRPTGHRLRVRRYDLTTAGRDAYRKIVADVVAASGKKEPERGDICYGKLALGKVTGWDGPTQVNGRQEASVRYTYKVESLADWAKGPEVGAAFPYVTNTVTGAGEQSLTTVMVLTSKGWVAKTS
ncbi:hypothetical protein OVY01_19970 [Robbsia sp. Bb-Pol-6]|uniref:Lipoprotein n=1 Tax=Robbsia betulipollinis TaxID=2981849 RepID=A0ABT3ZSA3_9BURK|nr:hypothetical protein [Robbsia betulipollinis]MCY0389426.1 hypothetical protein [Robbsia betulipollinis]